MKIAIDWSPSTIHGWGLYGLNIALAFADDIEVDLSIPQGECMIDPLRHMALSQTVAWQRDDADVFLHSLGNDVLPEPDTPRDRTVGVIFFEEPLSPEGIERAKRYPLIVAGSEWNRRLLREAGANVVMIHQGVDRSLFHPAPKIFHGRFPILSGGKAEWRKGQDITLKAFKAFAERHDDAVLVTAWHSPWPDMAKQIGGVVNNGKIDVAAWAAQEGIRPHQILDLGMVHNPMMPQIYREMACAVFPNRAEGGTNLVAMECLASGIPTFVSFNTGHHDLADDARFLKQTGHDSIGRGETAVESIVERLERHYTTAYESRVLSGFYWSDAAKKLKEACRSCATIPA